MTTVHSGGAINSSPQSFGIKLVCVVVYYITVYNTSHSLVMNYIYKSNARRLYSHLYNYSFPLSAAGDTYY